MFNLRRESLGTRTRIGALSLIILSMRYYTSHTHTHTHVHMHARTRTLSYTCMHTHAHCHTHAAFMLVDHPVEEESDEGFEIISWPTTPVTHTTRSNRK